MDDLIGKGLPMPIIAELMTYMSATLVTMAMPLGILLASIMTFGSLGESYELVAVKSSGISLFRFMRPLTIFVITIVGGMFLFSNYVIPEANLKAFSLLYDIRNQKPTMSIKPGVFNQEIGSFAIRVGAKSKDGATIKDVLIYDHTNTRSNNNVIIAKEGKMFLSNDKRFLVFELKDGWRYEIKKDDSGRYDQQRMYFKFWSKVIDVSSFSFSRTKEDLFKTNEEMMDFKLLTVNIDSMKRSQGKEFIQLQRNAGSFLSFYRNDSLGKSLTLKTSEYIKKDTTKVKNTPIIDAFPDSIKSVLAERVISNAESLGRYADVYKSNVEISDRRIRDFQMERHKKFTLAFACLVLFLVGAPMGAIVRKGGLGMPAVISISFFVVYFVLSTTGEKLAKQGQLSPFAGMWLATFVLLPIAIWVMIQARNDSPVFKTEAYLALLKRLRRFLERFTKSKQNKTKLDEE